VSSENAAIVLTCKDARLSGAGGARRGGAESDASLEVLTRSDAGAASFIVFSNETDLAGWDVRPLRAPFLVVAVACALDFVFGTECVEIALAYVAVALVVVWIIVHRVAGRRRRCGREEGRRVNIKEEMWRPGSSSGWGKEEL
jgi:hypothetical protein